MKTAGIVLIIFGGLSLFGNCVGMSANPEYAEQSIQGIVFAIGIIGLGIYLISRANKRKEEENERKKWEAGSDSD